MTTMTEQHYLQPGWLTRNVFNRTIRRLTRLGISVWGSRELHVQGRTSGKWHSTPVNLLTIDGTRYLVSPRGQSQWVRNLRVSGTGRLTVGRRSETFTAAELSDEDKVTVLREYLRRWKFEVGVFFDGLDHTASDEQFAAAAPRHPVFVVSSAGR